MLILLPPSEGKARPRRGAPLDPSRLSFSELTDARKQVLEALISLCETSDIDTACRVLGITAAQADYVRLNAALPQAPTTRADALYTGVLYDALDLASLTGRARSRASRWLVVTSALFGIVRPGDRLPSYRLSGGTKLPGIGGVGTHWRKHLAGPIESHRGLILDLRSSTYATFWKPSADAARRTATVRVLHEVNGKRSVVSHFNKATKGRIVRDLLVDGGNPTTPARLGEQLRDLGWQVEADGTALDVIVREV